MEQGCFFRRLPYSVFKPSTLVYQVNGVPDHEKSECSHSWKEPYNLAQETDCQGQILHSVNTKQKSLFSFMKKE